LNFVNSFFKFEEKHKKPKLKVYESKKLKLGFFSGLRGTGTDSVLGGR